MHLEPVDGGALTLVRRIAAPMDRVFDAFVEPTVILKWWGPDAGPTLHARTDKRLGGRFEVSFQTIDGARHENCGEYLEFDPPRRLVMSWWLSDAPGLRSRVTVDLRDLGSATEVTVLHEGLVEATVRADHENGWRGALEKLERALLPRLLHRSSTGR